MLRAPQMSDYGDWAALREASRAFLTPWEPTWPADDLTRPAFRRRLRRYAEDMRDRSGLSVLPVPQPRTMRWSAGLTLANIRRGVAQAGSLGYWIGAPYRAPGLHDRGRAGAACRSAFGRCGCTGSKRPAFRPMLASIRLLEKTGFRREGYAR